jgi:TetR/AcrR family transcriptional repressor of nem operon
MPRRPSFDRQDLIERARDVFWQQGWAGTSLKDLEKTLDLRPGSFYAAFGSKEALYELALDSYAHDGITRLKALAAEIGPLAALKAHPQWVATNKQNAVRACMLAKTFLELQAKNHPLADRASTHLASMEAVFKDLFIQAQAAGEISADHDPAKLARRYQSDLLGMRVSADRPDFDAKAVAEELSENLRSL